MNDSGMSASFPVGTNNKTINQSTDQQTVMEKWVAVYTKPRHEKVVYSQLSQKDITAYLPLIRQKRQWSDRKKWVDIPLFRSYVFAQILLKNSLYVLQTHGVHHIVKIGGNIAVVRDEEIQAIRQMIEGGFQPEGTDYFVEGDRVEVIGGPLRGVQGVVAWIKGENQFVLKIDAIQHAVSVHIDRRFLKPMK